MRLNRKDAGVYLTGRCENMEEMQRERERAEIMVTLSAAPKWFQGVEAVKASLILIRVCVRACVPFRWHPTKHLAEYLLFLRWHIPWKLILILLYSLY